MSRKVKPLIQNVKIEAIAAEGNALAHIDGKVLFVKQAIPGDIVDVQINKVRRGYSEGYIVRIVKPSADRIEPFCSHFSDCGGCSWQQLPYPLQLSFKQQQVEDQLKRIGHLNLPEISPIIGSEKTTEYRNKLEFTFSQRRWILRGEDVDSLTEEDRLGLGFHVEGYFDKVLDINRCHLQREPSNLIRNFLREWAITHHYSFWNLREQHGFLRNIVIRTASTGDVMLVVIFGSEAEGDENIGKRNALLDAVKEHFPGITSIYYMINSKLNDAYSDLPCVLHCGDEAIYEQMDGIRFKIGPKSFYQTNSEQAYRLYSVVRDFVRQSLDENGNFHASEERKPVIYDLYTGTGTIALFLSSLAEKVIGIEYVKEAIADAVENAARNNISNADFFAGDMKDVLNSGFIAEHGKPDIVVLDPPRAGIHPDVAGVLMETAPERIVYVSCNPSTQARDLAVFSEQYDIVNVQPVDMFPHTIHVENVVSLVKRHTVHAENVISPVKRQNMD